MVNLKRKVLNKIQFQTRKIHRVLGLVSFIPLFLSLSGALVFIWTDELSDLFYHNYKYSEESQIEKIDLTKLDLSLPVENWSVIDLYNEKNKNFVITEYQWPEDSKSIFWSKSHFPILKHHVNPNTGELKGIIESKNDLLIQAEYLHRDLLLRNDIGEKIVTWSTVSLIISILSGLILWIPKSKNTLFRRIWISKWKWNKNFRWYLHTVSGFWGTPFILILCLTGLVWSFQTINFKMIKLFEDKVPMKRLVLETEQVDKETLKSVYQRIILDAIKKRKDWSLIKIKPSFMTGHKKMGFVHVFIWFDKNKIGWTKRDDFIYSIASGDLQDSISYAQKNRGVKVRESNYAIHVGSIFGIPTKILATLITLICLILMFTGLMAIYQKKIKLF